MVRIFFLCVPHITHNLLKFPPNTAKMGLLLYLVNGPMRTCLPGGMESGGEKSPLIRLGNSFIKLLTVSMV